MTALTQPRASASQLLSRILDEPALVSSIRRLPPRALGRLIDHVGLEDAGEVVALATTEQLSRIFDDDLWRNARPGQAETFDGERFALWLEVMLEGGEGFCADRLADLDEELLTLALQRQLLVLDLDRFALEMTAASAMHSNLIDKALDECLQEELGSYLLIARHHDGWDALLAALLALDRDHADLLERLLSHCCEMSTEWIEDNGGLYEVLSGEEMLEADVGGDRLDRRAAEGYVSPTDAAAFLALARQTAPRGGIGGDPVTRAYFRNLAPPPPTPAPATSPTAAKQADGPTRLLAVLREAEVLDPRPGVAGLLTGAADDERRSRFREAMAALRARDPAGHGQRMQQLVYLANVLVAGASRGPGRRYRPVEAAERVVATCERGIERMLASIGRRTSAEELLAREGVVALFRVGWGQATNR